MSEQQNDAFLFEKLFSFAERQGHLSARQDHAEKMIDRMGDEIVKAQNQSALHVTGEIMRLETRIDVKLENDRAATRRQLAAMSDASREQSKMIVKAIIGVGVAIVAGVGALDHVETIVQILEALRR